MVMALILGLNSFFIFDDAICIFVYRLLFFVRGHGMREYRICNFFTPAHMLRSLAQDFLQGI